MANHQTPAGESDPVTFLNGRHQGVNGYHDNSTSASSSSSSNSTPRLASSIEDFPTIARTSRFTNLADLRQQVYHLGPERGHFATRHAENAEIRAAEDNTDNSHLVNGITARPRPRLVRNAAFTRLFRARGDAEQQYPIVNGVTPEANAEQVVRNRRGRRFLRRLTSGSSFLTRTSNAAESFSPHRAHNNDNSNLNHNGVASSDTTEPQNSVSFRNNHLQHTQRAVATSNTPALQAPVVVNHDLQQQSVVSTNSSDSESLDSESSDEGIYIRGGVNYWQAQDRCLNLERPQSTTDREQSNPEVHIHQNDSDNSEQSTRHSESPDSDPDDTVVISARLEALYAAHRTGVEVPQPVTPGIRVDITETEEYTRRHPNPNTHQARLAAIEDLEERARLEQERINQHAREDRPLSPPEGADSEPESEESEAQAPETEDPLDANQHLVLRRSELRQNLERQIDSQNPRQRPRQGHSNIQARLQELESFERERSREWFEEFYARRNERIARRQRDQNESRIQIEDLEIVTGSRLGVDIPRIPQQPQLPELSRLRPAGHNVTLRDFELLGVQGLQLLQGPAAAIEVFQEHNTLLVVATDLPGVEFESETSSISDPDEVEVQHSPAPNAPQNTPTSSEGNLALESSALDHLVLENHLRELQDLNVTHLPEPSSTSGVVNSHPETSSMNMQASTTDTREASNTTGIAYPESPSISSNPRYPVVLTSSPTTQVTQDVGTDLETPNPTVTDSPEISSISDTVDTEHPAAPNALTTNQTRALYTGDDESETSNTSQSTRAVNPVNSQDEDSGNSSTAIQAAIENTEVAWALYNHSDDLSLADDSSPVNENQAVNTENSDPSDPELSNITAVSTEIANTSRPLLAGSTLINASYADIEGVNNNNSGPSVPEDSTQDTNNTATSTEVASPLPNLPHTPTRVIDLSSFTNVEGVTHTQPESNSEDLNSSLIADSTHVRSIIPYRPDTPSSTNSITYFTDNEGVNHAHPEPRVPVETNTRLTATPIEAADTSLPVSQFSHTIEVTHDDQHHEISTPTTPTQATIVSDRFTTPDRPLIGQADYSGPRPTTPIQQSIPIAPLSPRDAQTTIRPRRQRRTTVTEAGSPVRTAPTAPGAPQSPLWHFNRLQNNAANTAHRLGPSGPRLNSPPLPPSLPTLRRVAGSESLRALSAEHGQPNPPLAAVAADEPEADVFGDQDEEEEQQEEAVMEPAGAYAVPEEEDLPAYNPAADDFIEGDGEEEEERVEGPEGAMVEQARHYLHQVGHEVNVLDEIEATTLVRGSGAAVRARLGLLLAEDVVVGALRAAVGAVELHRMQTQRLFDLAQVLRAEGMEAQLRADSNALLLEETRLELAALRRRIQRGGRNGH
ncbi:hypothetical protein LTR84_002304 [Exophiala bonariae]|uniref:Uncharacterized protein n=1 Tax=Exophiala bonariae TaxID=1690606 RepID=A0AAV9NFI4_9EURO|nr:hypothetical protein LTR84_002304 [Exophiala bonariae]